MFLSSTRKKAKPSAECRSNPQLLVISYAFNCLNACTIRQARFCMKEGREERRMKERRKGGMNKRRKDGKKERRKERYGRRGG